MNAANIWYVNSAATGGNNNGSSWQHAFTDLQAALAVATSGDSIWVAQGTYRPTSGTNRTISFHIPKGVALLGGFVGNESSALQRSSTMNETILSGDIGAGNNITDNSYHVLIALGSDSTTVIDGFTITSGNASVSDFFAVTDRGGGLFVASDPEHPVSCPLVSNCIFLKNRARYGGAVHAESTDSTFANPILHDCSFLQNFSTEHAGAVYVKGGASSMPPRHISGCSFVGNKVFSLGFGGAIYISDLDNTIHIDNCLFEKDTAQSSGGAICHEGIHEYSNIFLDGCTFRENVGNSGGGFFHFFSGYPTDSTKYCHIVFNNCSFYKNKAKNNRGGAIEIADFHSSSKTEINNSVFEANQANNGGAGIHVYNNCGFPGFCDNELIIEGCRFEGNHSVLTPAANAIFYVGNGNEGARNKSRITNNTFLENEGAIAMLSGNKGGVDATVANCTFYHNGTWPIIKNWDAAFDSSFFNNMAITNSIIWENVPIHNLFYNNSPTNYTIHDYNIHHSIVNVPDCVVAGVDGCDEGMLYQVYPMFFDTISGDLRVAACSPAINAGENQTVQALSIPYDIEGFERIINDTVDMGAYERSKFSFELAGLQDASCLGNADGSVDFEMNGDAPFMLNWVMDSLSGINTNNLNPGAYNFILMDNFGCMDSLTIEIGNTTNIQIQYAITNASVFGAADGTIAIDSTFGGVAPYSYFWEDGNAGPFRGNLPAGTYQVTIMDADSCLTVQSFEITAPNQVNNHQLGANIRFFPNPADDLIWIEAPPISEQAKFAIYLPTAQAILNVPLTNSRTEVSINGLLPGFYFWEIRDKGLIVASGKFVKN